MVLSKEMKPIFVLESPGSLEHTWSVSRYSQVTVMCGPVQLILTFFLLLNTSVSYFISVSESLFVINLNDKNVYIVTLKTQIHIVLGLSDAKLKSLSYLVLISTEYVIT